MVFEGLYTPANQAFSPVSPYHVNLPVPPRDVDKAKALLKAAGVTTPLSVNLLVPNNPTSQQVGQVLQAMVAEAGFNLNLQMTEFATLLDRQQSGDYQLSFSGWSGRPDPDGSIYGFINSKGTLNDGRYSNAQIDEWLTQARQSTDQSRTPAAVRQGGEAAPDRHADCLPLLRAAHFWPEQKRAGL